MAVQSPAHQVVVFLAVVSSLCLAPTPTVACGDPALSRNVDVIRDSYLLTEGETLRLSCSVCGVCISPSDPMCSNRHTQIWMAATDRTAANIDTKTRVSRTTTRINSFRTFIRRAKEKVEAARRRALKAALTVRMYASMAVQRFDRLKRLSLESEGGAGVIKELWNPSVDDSQLQWYVESANGQVSRVKHVSGGKRLIFDRLVISRINTGDTGIYTCMMNDRVRARFIVTVVEAGVEPYREFQAGNGRSMQAKLLPKANLEVYTRWAGHTKTLLLPLPAGAQAGVEEQEAASTGTKLGGYVKAANITISWGICYVRQLDPDRPVKPEGSSSLKLMRQGLPCRSHVLPLSIRSLLCIIKRPSETRKEQRIVQASESKLHFGLHGNAFKTNSPPPLAVDATVIKRSFMLAKQGEFVSLQCPLKQTVRTLIAWFVLPKQKANESSGNEIPTKDILEGVLSPFNLRESSGGRRFSDPGGNLNIASVNKTIDERKYYCLHNGRLVGYVNLLIRHAKEESTAMHVASLIMNVLKVASPMVIAASIIFLTLVTASSMFEPEVQW